MKKRNEVKTDKQCLLCPICVSKKLKQGITNVWNRDGETPGTIYQVDTVGKLEKIKGNAYPIRDGLEMVITCEKCTTRLVFVMYFNKEGYSV